MANPNPVGEDPNRNPSLHEEIARRAYEIWEQENRFCGNHERHWLEAERQVRGTSAAPSSEPAKASPAPAAAGNPAYPSLAERQAIVAGNSGKAEPVKIIPANELKKSRR